MDYRQLLNELVEDLKSNETVILDDYYLGRGLLEKRARDLAAQHSLRLSDAILEFFTQIDGAVIEWRLDPNAADKIRLRQPSDLESIRGFAYIYTLDELVPEWTNLRNTPFDAGMEDKSQMRAFRPFDKNVEEAFAGFTVKDAMLVDDMVYLRQYEDLVSLRTDLPDYIQSLVECKAFLWWQDALASRPGGRTTDDLYYYVPQIFEGETLNSLRR